MGRIERGDNRRLDRLSYIRGMRVARNRLAPDAIHDPAGADRYQLRGVTRALDILIMLGTMERPADLSAIARAVDLHPTTALRHLESLRSRGFVESIPGGGYDLGATLFELGSIYLRDSSIWHIGSDLARQLASTANETASVGVLSNGQILYIAIANGQRELGIQSVVGSRHPVHCTALGKAILAGLPWPDVESVLKMRPMQQLTAHTIVDMAHFRDELSTTALRGYSVDDEEHGQGILCIGAPIRDQSGAVVAAISVSGPKFRVIDAGVDFVAGLVVGMAAKGSQQLGDSLSFDGAAMPSRVTTGSR